MNVFYYSEQSKKLSYIKNACSLNAFLNNDLFYSFILINFLYTNPQTYECIQINKNKIYNLTSCNHLKKKFLNFIKIYKFLNLLEFF